MLLKARLGPAIDAIIDDRQGGRIVFFTPPHLVPVSGKEKYHGN